eukprot:scaffold98655_cov45-Prasinocladus_malaysianus.AAC.1
MLGVAVGGPCNPTGPHLVGESLADEGVQILPGQWHGPRERRQVWHGGVGVCRTHAAPRMAQPWQTPKQHNGGPQHQHYKAAERFLEGWAALEAQQDCQPRPPRLASAGAGGGQQGIAIGVALVDIAALIGGYRKGVSQPGHPGMSAVAANGIQLPSAKGLSIYISRKAS